MKRGINIIGMAGQWLAVFLLIGGISIEIHYMADIGFLSITLGACTFAVFTKVRELYYKSLTNKKSIFKRRR